MTREQSNYEYMIFRPKLPQGWDCLEQTENARSASTSYTRWGKSHHNGEDRRFFVVFCEMNPFNYKNHKIGYKYTVRGGNDIKPNNAKLRFFNNLKDAENYMIYLMECTDRWISEINAPEYIADYNKKIEALIKQKEIERENEYQL